MKLRSAAIIYWQGKFYIPSMTETASGIFVHSDPVLVTEIDTIDLARVMEKVLLAPRPRVPDIPREEWKKRKDPVLMATGAKRWKELAKKGASYAISWTADKKVLYVSRVTKSGVWEFDPGKTQVFPVDTPIEAIAKIIVDDLQSRE